MSRQLLFFLLGICLLNILLSKVSGTEESSKPVERTISDTLAELLPADLTDEQPTVLVALLVRNKAHVLPLFLTYFERLNYPRERIALWIRSDHNNDSSIELLQLWLNHTSELYHSVNVGFEQTPTGYENETTAFDWPRERFQNLISMKEAALAYARSIWADFIFYLDADVLLTSADTLRYLTRLRLPVVAPMLLSESLYSNFWCGMSRDYYYLRTDEYKEIYNVIKDGTFQVRMVHSAVLINLRHMAARYLTFDRERLIIQQENGLEWLQETSNSELCRLYDGPLDDIIIFAMSANCSQIPIFVNNELSYGYLLQPLERLDTTATDKQQLINIRVNIINDLGGVANVADYWQPYMEFPEKQTLTLDRIYMINLERRTERRGKMETLFNEIGLKVDHFPAIDGKTLNPQVLEEMHIKILSGYEDPYHHRQMTMGEIGCFLSHYRIWERIVEEGLKEVLILEDDIRFEPNFRERAIQVLDQARSIVEYDLIYFGRKRLKEEHEPLVLGADNLVHVGYSYWTLGYVITQSGARKLLAAKPLDRLVPVDEFLPIMFGRNPNKTWSAAYPTPDLIAFSAAPLLLFPTHYTGDAGYISDTEDSELTPDQLNEAAANAKAADAAQLKSDRELHFPQYNAGEEFKLPNADLSDLSTLSVGKSHEEF